MPLLGPARETRSIPSRGQQTPSPHHTPYPCSGAAPVPQLVMAVAWGIQPQRSILIGNTPVPASRAGSRQWGSLHPVWHPPPRVLQAPGPPIWPGPAQENAVVSFYSCPAIIFSQFKTTLAKSAGSFYCFRQGFPFSPRPGEFLLRLGLHWLSPRGPALCHDPSPLGHLHPRVGVPGEGQQRAQGNASGPHNSKMLLPLSHEPLLEVETKGKEWLEV